MMKKRFSVNKAEWSETCEESYKKECYKIAFEHRVKLEIENEIAYVRLNDERIELIKPEKTKTFWFETWTKLKKYLSG